MDDREPMPPVLAYSSWRPPAVTPVTTRRQVIGAILGVVIGSAAGCVLLFCAGAGHGSYLPAKLLFPLPMALTGITGSITRPLLIIAGLQYPLYGLLVGWLIGRNQVRRAMLLLLGIHLCGLALGMSLSASTFSP
jgi:hypothetical protein